MLRQGKLKRYRPSRVGTMLNVAAMRIDNTAHNG
jgi:hypothetical protein